MHETSPPPACRDGMRRNAWPLPTSYVFNLLQLTYTQIRVCRKNSRGFEDGLQCFRALLSACYLGPGSQIGPKRPIEYMAKCCILSAGCNAHSYLYICKHGIKTSLTYQSHWHTCMDKLSISSCDHFHPNMCQRRFAISCFILIILYIWEL